MTDPAPADPTPAPPDPGGQRGRPMKVVERDLAVARVLAERERSLHEVMAALGLEWRITYNSVCRLRERGLAELHRNGTRTPTWRVTERGHEWLGTAPSGDEPGPEDPAPTEVAAPEPVVHVPTVVVPDREAAAQQPVPIEPPPVPEPVGVAPSPGPEEPVWPV